MALADVSPELKELICSTADVVLYKKGHSENCFICNVEADDDASGDEVLFIYLCYQKPNIEPTAKLMAELRNQMRKVLVARGDPRFPHIRHMPFVEEALAS